MISALHIPGNPFHVNVGAWHEHVRGYAQSMEPVRDPRITVRCTFYTKQQPASDISLYVGEAVDALVMQGIIRGHGAVIECNSRALPSGRAQERVVLSVEPHWTMEDGVSDSDWIVNE